MCHVWPLTRGSLGTPPESSAPPLAPSTAPSASAVHPETNQTREARVYSHDGPIGRGKHGYILTTDQPPPARVDLQRSAKSVPSHSLSLVSGVHRLGVGLGFRVVFMQAN
eukprot:3372266-Pyramimonas_sp.AAC.1